MDIKTWKVNKQATQLPYFDDMLMPLMIIIYRRHGVEYQHLGKWLIRYLKLQDIQAKLEANNSLDFTFNQVIKDLTDIGICYIIYSKLVEYSLRGFSPESRYFFSKYAGFDFIRDSPSLEGIKQAFSKEKSLGKISSKENYDGIEQYIISLNDRIYQLNAILESPSVIVQKDLRTSIEERLSEYNYTDFEKIIVKILADIYKGESLVTRASKDGGIDGIIRFQQGFNEQLLIVQVKKHKETTVGVEKIRAFSAVVDKYQENISKIGIFFTTSTFSLDAKKFVSNQAGNMSIVTTDNLITQMIIGRVGILDNSGTLILNEDYYNLI